MSTDSHPDDIYPSGEPDREAPAVSGDGFVGGDQDGWQAPDAGAFTGTSPYPYPSQGSAQGSPYPGYGSYQTPPVGQPGPPPGYPPYAPGGQPGYGAHHGGQGPGGPAGSGYTPYPGVPGDHSASGAPGYGGYASLLAPKPSIIPLRPLSIGEILGGAFEALRANPKAMFVPSLVVMSIVGLISAGGFVFFLSRLSLPGVTTSEELTEAETEADLDQLGSSIAGLIAQYSLTTVLVVLAASILTGLLIVTVSRTILGRKASLGDVWQRTKPRVWALIGQSIIIQLILGVAAVVLVAIGAGIFWLALNSASGNGDDTSVGLIILAILGAVALVVALMLALFALSCKLSLAPAALVLENIGVFEGISRSWTLTRGYFWRVVGIRVLSTIIVGLTSWAASSVLSALTQGLALLASNAILAVMAGSILASSLIQAVTMPFDSAVVALIYTDLRMRSEGLDVELRRAAGV